MNKYNVIKECVRCGKTDAVNPETGLCASCSELKYRVTIDLGSKVYEVIADSEEAAKQKAINRFERDSRTEPMTEEYWVGECEVIDDE